MKRFGITPIQQFAEQSITFTLERPTAGEFSTIYIGGTDARFRLYGGSYFALAEGNDFGNTRLDDNAFVFSDTIIDRLEFPSFETLSIALTDVIGRETDRLHGRIPPGDWTGPGTGLDAVASHAGPSLFQYPIVPSGGDGRSAAVVTQHFGQGFGDTITRGHLGTDFRGSTGTPVYAIADGKVTEVKDIGGSWGKIVIIEHRTTTWDWDKDVYSMYAHVDNTVVAKGQLVHRGQKLTEVGPTAPGSTGPHLHLEVRSGIEAWWRPGPGYLGRDFNRISSSSVTRADYPNLKWYDPVKLITENLYPIEVWMSNPSPAPGETITIYSRIPTSTLPQNNGQPDLTNVAVTFSIPGLSTQSGTVRAASPNLSAGQAASLTAAGYLDVSQRLVVDSGANNQAYPARATIQIENNTPIQSGSSSGARPSQTYLDPVATFTSRFGLSSAWLEQYATSMSPRLQVADAANVRNEIVRTLAYREVKINDQLPNAASPQPKREGLQNRRSSFLMSCISNHIKRRTPCVLPSGLSPSSAACSPAC